MSLEYGLPIPLRLYENVGFQNRFKVGGSIRTFNLYCPSNRILPFQIVTNVSADDLSSMDLIRVSDGQRTSIFGLIQNGQIRSYTVGASKYFVHYGTADLGITFDSGEYYLEMSNGTSDWFSEVMTMRNFSYDITGNSCITTRIEYWATCDVDGIFYRGYMLGHPQFKNIVYLDVEPGKPNYLYSEDGEEDGNKVFLADLKVLEKEYYLETPMPEYMTDALSLLPMHVGKKGFVEVMTKQGYLSRVDKVRVEPEWQQDDGAWAMTEIFLITETVLATNCCPGMDDIQAGGSITADCFSVYTEALSGIPFGSLLYNADHYRDLATGLATPIPEGALMIVSGISPAFRIQTFTGGTFVDESPVLGQVFLDKNVYDSDESLDFPYVYATGVGADAKKYPKILSNTDNGNGTWTIQGTTYANAIVDVYNQVNGVNHIVATIPSNTFLASGATFTRLAGANRVFIHCRTDNGCDLLASNLFAFELEINTGIGNMTIGTDFIVAGSLGELP